jgi:hypothetical protein
VNFQRMRQPLASVTRDGHFAYVQVGCGHVTCKREGELNLIAIITIVRRLSWQRPINLLKT